MNNLKTKTKNRITRKRRIRSKLFGTPEKPRLSVFKSNRYIYVQVIDDSNMGTLASYSSNLLKPKPKGMREAAKAVGKKIAEKSIALGIKEIAFDRSGYKYTGVIKELADSARGEGLKF